MDMYLIDCDYGGYDTYGGFVIAAKNEANAIAIAQTYQSNVFTDDESTIKIIGKASDDITEEGLLLASFHAG